MGACHGRRVGSIERFGYAPHPLSTLTADQTAHIARVFNALAGRGRTAHVDAIDDWLAHANATVTSSTFFPVLLRFSEAPDRSRLTLEEFVRLVERACLVTEQQFKAVLFGVAATSVTPTGDPLLNVELLAARFPGFAAARSVRSSVQGVFDAAVKQVVARPVAARRLLPGQPRETLNLTEFLDMDARSGRLLHGVLFMRHFLMKHTLGEAAWNAHRDAWLASGRANALDSAYVLDPGAWPALLHATATRVPLAAPATTPHAAGSDAPPSPLPLPSVRRPAIMRGRSKSLTLPASPGLARRRLRKPLHMPLHMPPKPSGSAADLLARWHATTACTRAASSRRPPHGRTVSPGRRADAAGMASPAASLTGIVLPPLQAVCGPSGGLPGTPSHRPPPSPSPPRSTASTRSRSGSTTSRHSPGTRRSPRQHRATQAYEDPMVVGGGNNSDSPSQRRSWSGGRRRRGSSRSSSKSSGRSPRSLPNAL